jgi:hypothetical protein
MPTAKRTIRTGVSGPMSKEMSPSLDIIEQEAEKDHQPYKIIYLNGHRLQPAPNDKPRPGTPGRR